MRRTFTVAVPLAREGRMRAVMRPAFNLLAGAVLAAVCFGNPARAQGPAPAFVPRDERIEDLPDTPGRDETFGMCTACHGYRLVSNQGMTRDKWDETLNWMTERHNMPDIQGADRQVILDYLAKHHPPKAPSQAGGFRNPFAPP